MSVRTLGVSLAAGLLLAAAGPTVALAHRFDGVFSDRSGPPGTQVTVDLRIWKIEWNPFIAGVGPPLFRENNPTLTLTRTTPCRTDQLGNTVCRARRDVSFRIPRVRPGRYIVAAYDAGEGHSHYSWTIFRVTPRSELPNTGPPALYLPLAPALLLLGSVFVLMSRR
jgi:hypothetical protein